jgi:ubiquitin conjugation factor E4 B
VLNHFAKVVQINTKRGGMQVDPATVASDGYMINMQAALLRFVENFVDAKFSKVG